MNLNQTSKPIHQVAWMLTLAIAVIGMDQLSKWIATESLAGHPPQYYLFQSISLQFALNPGGFLSLGGSLSQEMRQWLFIGANGLLLAGIFAFLLVRWQRLTTGIFACLTLVLAGGVGNMIDRIVNNGHVTDFIVLIAGPMRTGVFNIADIAITGGFLGIAAIVFFSDATASSPSEVTEGPNSENRSVQQTLIGDSCE